MHSKTVTSNNFIRPPAVFIRPLFPRLINFLNIASRAVVSFAYLITHQFLEIKFLYTTVVNINVYS